MLRVLQNLNNSYNNSIKIYDIDGDHRLSVWEAQMLAKLRYDVESHYATIVFEDVSHRADHTVALQLFSTF